MRALLAIALLAFAANVPAYAGMGPCKPDGHEGYVCGEGADSARLIGRSSSPDGRFGFAWRDPGNDTTGEPASDELDLLLVRQSDGTILGRSKTGYWNTGEMHVNRLQEDVFWSPDSRLAVHAFQTRFETERFELFVLGHGDAPVVLVDLQKPAEAAVRAKLGKKAGSRVFSVQNNGDDFRISNAGAVHFMVNMWRPKEGPEDYFAVSFNIVNGKSGIKIGPMTVRKTKAPQ